MTAGFAPFLLGVVCLVSLSSCTKTFDAMVVNPCDRSLHVETFDIPPGQIEGEEPNARATLGAVTALVLKDAFSDAAGRSWSVRVRTHSWHVVPISGRARKDLVVIIPARLC